MSTKTRYKCFVLIGPCGKQAGRTDQREIARQIAAIELTKKGRGGGILSLLLPKSPREKRILRDLVSRGYKVKKILTRTSYRKDVRQAIRNDEIIAQLAVHYDLERRNSTEATSAVIPDFSEWVCQKLSDTSPNEIKRIVGSAHDELLNMKQSDWWKKQLKQRVRR
jgi:hypothetical protein